MKFRDACGREYEFLSESGQRVLDFSFLLLIMFITMVMMALDDLERHREDNKVSEQTAETIHGSIVWRDVRVGDLVVLRENEQIPAGIRYC